jgi:hypothetical protein
MPNNDFTGFQQNTYGEGSTLLNINQNINCPVFKSIKPLKNAIPSANGTFAPAIMGGSERGGAIAKGESFRSTDGVKSIQPSIKTKTVVWPIEVDKKDIELSRNSKAAKAQIMDVATQLAMTRINQSLERQVCGSGTGQVTQANGSGSSSTSLIVDNVLSLRAEMYIDVWSALGGTKRTLSAPVKILTVNPDTNTLTLEEAITWSDNDLVCAEGALDGVSAIDNAKEIMGVDGMVDASEFSTTFETVNTSTYPAFVGQVVSASSAPVSQDVLQRLHNRVMLLSGKEPDEMWSNFGQFRTFVGNELDKVRYEPGEIKAGTDTPIKWGKMTWKLAKDMPLGRLFMLNSSEYGKVQTRDVHLTDANGIQYYQISNKHAIGTYYEYEGTIGTWARFSHGKLTNLTEPTL